jgi:hypothetical protein
MGAERKVRRVLLESSLKPASFRQRAITSSARFMVSPVVRTGFYGYRKLRVSAQAWRMTFAAPQPITIKATKISQLYLFP